MKLDQRIKHLEAIKNTENIQITVFVVDKDTNGRLRKYLARTTVINPDGSTEKLEHTKLPIEQWEICGALNDDLENVD